MYAVFWDAHAVVTVHHSPSFQAVVELGRKIRERATKPVKFPLKKLVVVHPDQAFLDDVQGACAGQCVGCLIAGIWDSAEAII